MDEEGRTTRAIPLPRRDVVEKDWYSVFVARGLRGQLHYVMCVRPPHRPLSEEAPLRLGAPGQRRQGGAQVRCGIPEPFGRITCQFRVKYSVVAVHPANTYPIVSGGARPRWLAAPGAVAELGHEEAQGHAHVRGTRALR